MNVYLGEMSSSPNQNWRTLNPNSANMKTSFGFEARAGDENICLKRQDKNMNKNIPAIVHVQ